MSINMTHYLKNVMFILLIFCLTWLLQTIKDRSFLVLEDNRKRRTANGMLQERIRQQESFFL
jgi:hypothetical protein